jgi:hypothetical protein
LGAVSIDHQLLSIDKLKTQLEKEQVIMERNLSYYRTTNRVSKKELELRSKVC